MRLETVGRLGQVQTQAISMHTIQSIRVLQYTAFELCDYLQSEADRNPFLEVEMPSPVVAPPPRGGVTAGAPGPDISETLAHPVTLSEHLREQAALVFSGHGDRMVADYLIHALDCDGCLRQPTTQIAAQLGVPEDRVLAVLKQVQHFEPSGVGARDLAECLALQLRDRGELNTRYRALLANPELLRRLDLAGLAAACDTDQTGVRNMLARLSRLNPAPGRQYDCDPVQPALPEVLVAEAPEGGFSVTLNDALLPRALVDRAYHARIRAEATEPDTRAFITERVKQASWIVRTLDRRAVTILKVARAIVTYQRDYFHHGVDHLRPLSLQRVAETVGVNQSTVSRAIADKYLMGPRGLVALKYFFPEAVGKSDVEAVSNEAVRHRIRKLVEAEAPASVLSDDAIVRALAEENIDLARRTVAKYRAQMGIPSSAQRRRIRRAALPA